MIAEIFSKLFGVNDLGDVFSKIVGSFKLPPEKAAELEQLRIANAGALQKLQAELEEKAQDTLQAEVAAASANIRAEAANGDRFTSRARPAFLYVCYVVLLNNFIVLPYLGTHGGKPIEFPEALYWLMGSCILGYTGARTWEKIGVPKGVA
jgi:hypothetical protein